MTEFKFKVGDKVRRDDLHARAAGRYEAIGLIVRGATGFHRQADPREWVTVQWIGRDGRPGSKSDRLAEGLSLIERPE
jgi:hypothetical protein